MIDRESAYEILNKKIEQITQVKEAEEATQQESSERKGKEKSVVGEILGSTVTRQIGRTRSYSWIAWYTWNRRNKKKKRPVLVTAKLLLEKRKPILHFA